MEKKWKRKWRNKIDLNEENQDIVAKIFELKKLEKEKKFTYTIKADFKKKEEKEKLMVKKLNIN